MAGKGLTASVIAGSDVVFDLACDICADFDKNFEAFGYCQDCGDYLCRECYIGHGKQRVSRNHRLQDRKSMPRKKPAAPTRPATAGFEICAKHPNRTAEYYCKDDKLFGCSVCMTTKHRSCQAVDHIPDISGHLLDSSDFKEFCNTLYRIQTQARDVIKASKDNVGKAEECFNDAQKSLKILRKKVNDAFDTFEENMIRSTETIKSADVKKLANISDQGQSVLDEVGNISTELQSLKKNKQLDQLFVKMVKQEDTLQTFETILHEADAENTVATYTIEPGPRVREILADPPSIGEMCLQGSPAAIFPPAATRPTQQKQAEKPPSTKAKATATAPTHVLTSGDIKAVSVGDICVETKGENEVCYITGSALLPGNKLVLVAHNYYKVKLVNVQISKVIPELKTSSKPWDITSISGDTVAVTVPDSSEILIVKVTDQLRLDRKLPVDGQCHAVLHNNGNLIVSYIKPSKIEIISLDGKAKSKIAHSESFRSPEYMALSHDNKSVYVSDYYGGCVTRLSLDGAVQATYKDKKLVCSAGVVVVGKQDRLLVCGCLMSGNILLLEPGLTQVKVLLQGIRCPRSLSYCHSTGRLYVGMNGSNYIKEYQLS